MSRIISTFVKRANIPSIKEIYQNTSEWEIEDKIDKALETLYFLKNKCKYEIEELYTLAFEGGNNIVEPLQITAMLLEVDAEIEKARKVKDYLKVKRQLVEILDDNKSRKVEDAIYLYAEKLYCNDEGTCNPSPKEVINKYKQKLKVPVLNSTCVEGYLIITDRYNYSNLYKAADVADLLRPGDELQWESGGSGESPIILYDDKVIGVLEVVGLWPKLNSNVLNKEISIEKIIVKSIRTIIEREKSDVQMIRRGYGRTRHHKPEVELDVYLIETNVEP